MTILDDILEIKKDEIAKLKKKYSLNSFKEMEFFNTSSLSFYKEIKNNKNVSIIAEIKKASPSKGIIKKDFNHVKIAEEYFSSGINAVSILTDERFFQGSISFLRDIAAIKKVPLLRKDFIIDEFQVFEAKANGADLILLICEALSKNQINELTNAAVECGLEVLLELHSKEQIDKINFKENKIIGVNNRNLKTFEVDLNTTALLSKYIDDDLILVSESGISKKEDLDFLKSFEIDAILVGELLMRSVKFKSKIHELKSWCVKSNGEL